MMHYTKVVRGFLAYEDAEILSKLNGSLKGWAVGVILELLGEEAEIVYREIQNIPMVGALRVIDGENIDVERLMSLLHKQAQRGSATANIRFFGPITFTSADVDSLHRHIMQAGGMNG